MTIGLHPCEVAQEQVLAGDVDAYMRYLEDMYSQHGEHIVAIGETGIDVYYE